MAGEHAQATVEVHDPVVTEVTVGVAPAHAWRLFTDDVATWWPIATHSVTQDAASTVAFVGDQLVEAGPDGVTYPWGRVLTWEPGRELAFTWHPGREEETAQRVTVTFTAVEDGSTRVVLEHAGWENLGERAGETRSHYVDGWVTVLGHYAAAAATT